MDGDGDDLLGLLFLIIILIPVLTVLALLVWLLLWLYDHPDEVKRFAWAAFLVVWSPFLAAARAGLFLSRDLAVWAWRLDASDADERWALALWLAGVPALYLGAASMAALAALLQRPELAPAQAAASALAVATPLVAAHYFLYFKRPLKHPNWPLFIAAEEQLFFDIRRWLRERRLRLALWWTRLGSD